MRRSDHVGPAHQLESVSRSKLLLQVLQARNVGGLRHNDPVKIFLSSVRAGLEVERDALPGLIKALGHDPVRFEDFTAQAVPSRQACIQGIEASDVYLLILGPHYGNKLPETGQSATHDEWVTAQRIGLPRYVFRKTGIELDPEQATFEKTLGDYGSGRFYRTFGDVTELQTAVAGVLRELSAAPDPLGFKPLSGPVSIQWWNDPDMNRGFTNSQRPRLEVHIAPLGGAPLSGRLLEQVLDGLPNHVRASGLVSATEALETGHGVTDITLTVPSPTNVRWGDTYSGSLTSVRVRTDGQIAVMFSLPGDQMGSLLNVQDVTARTAAALRLAGQIDLTGAPELAVGVGVTSASMVTIGEIRQSSRSSSHMSMNDAPVRVEPDETVTRTALDRGADEVAATLSRSLLRAFAGLSR